jgi:hypothetical protein
VGYAEALVREVGQEREQEAEEEARKPVSGVVLAGKAAFFTADGGQIGLAG